MCYCYTSNNQPIGTNTDKDTPGYSQQRRTKMRGDILILALTMWFEAQNQGEDGMLKVADTIYNRAEGNPKKMVEVVLKPGQYECWNNKNPSTITQPKIPFTNEKLVDIWFFCWDTAKTMLDGKYVPTCDATHYWKVGTEMKGWMYNMITLFTHKDHIFSKEA